MNIRYFTIAMVLIAITFGGLAHANELSCVSFTATPSKVKPGDEVTLTWRAQGDYNLLRLHSHGSSLTEAVELGSSTSFYRVIVNSSDTFVLTVVGTNDEVGCAAAVSVDDGTLEPATARAHESAPSGGDLVVGPVLQVRPNAEKPNPWKAFMVNPGGRHKAADPALSTRDTIAETYRDRPKVFTPGALEETLRLLRTYHNMDVSTVEDLARLIEHGVVKLVECTPELLAKVHVMRFNIETRTSDPDWERDYCYKDEKVLMWRDKSREYTGAWRPFLMTGCLNPVLERDTPFRTPPIDLGTTPTVRCPDQATFDGAKCARGKP